MKLFLTVALLSAGSAAMAQMTLEQNYNGTSMLQSVTLEGEGDKYYLWDTTSKTIKIYNPDHSLWKSITPSVPPGHTFYILLPPSTKLFDLDNSVEVLYSIYETSSFLQKLIVLNEDGSVLQSIPDANYAWVKKVNGSWKLLATGTSKNAVYGLPGSLPQQSTGFKPAAKEEPETSIYPNPVDISATLTYSLPKGTTHAPLHIYNSEGKLVRELIVTDQETQVVLHRNGLPAGNYIYVVAGQKQQFVVR